MAITHYVDGKAASKAAYAAAKGHGKSRAVVYAASTAELLEAMQKALEAKHEG